MIPPFHQGLSGGSYAASPSRYVFPKIVEKLAYFRARLCGICKNESLRTSPFPRNVPPFLYPPIVSVHLQKIKPKIVTLLGENVPDQMMENQVCWKPDYFPLLVCRKLITQMCPYKEMVFQSFSRVVKVTQLSKVLSWSVNFWGAIGFFVYSLFGWFV